MVSASNEKFFCMDKEEMVGKAFVATKEKPFSDCSDAVENLW